MRRYRIIAVVAAILAIGVSATGAVAAERRYVADVAVVGGGSTGLAAAVVAAEGGAKVVLLEKNPYLGGGSNFAEGLFAVESELQRAKAYGLTKEEAFRHIMEFGHYKTDAPLLRQFVEGSAANIEWLRDHGVEMEAIHISPTEPMVWHVIRNRGQYVHGGALVTALQEKLKERGGVILLRTPGKKLIRTGNRVTGVEATDHKGNRVIVDAGAVIIGTGGFGNSKEKIAKWTKFDPERFKPTLPLNKTGDGIRMAVDAGADHEGENLMLHLGTEGKGIIPLGHIYAMTWEPNLWVNKSGERFTNEDVVFSFPMAANTVARQRGHFAWSIFDDGEVEYVMTRGVKQGIGVIIPVMTKLANLKEEIRNAVASDSDAFKAGDSIEELAKKIDVPAAALKKTFDDYNRYAACGRDAQFFKATRWMRPLTKGKLYAVKLYPYHFTSIGGIRVNRDMAVIDRDDRPIEGLYAGGCDVGGLYSDTYTLWASGHAYGFAVYSGRMAGESALRALGKK
jgi:fumarate reductase flavoprotein subunit